MKQKKNHYQGSISIFIVLLVIFMAELLFYTWCRVQCVETGYKISQAKEHHRRLIALQKNLRVELANLKSPERIVRIARKKLGLVIPGPRQIIVIP